MPTFGLPTRRRRLAMLGGIAAVLCWPAWLFITSVYVSATAGRTTGSPKGTIAFERLPTGYAGYWSSPTIDRGPGPVGTPVASLTFTARHFLRTDRRGIPLHTIDSFTCVWSPAPPSEDVVDAIIESWAKSTPDYHRVRHYTEAFLYPLTLNDVLKSPSGRIEKRYWGNIISAAWSESLLPLLGCGILGLPILIGLYFTLRHRSRESQACSKCGYPTTGLPTHTCPECGTNLSHPPN